MNTHAEADFAQYTKAYLEAGASVFINEKDMTATAVMNLGTADNPGTADNTPTLTCTGKGPLAHLLKAPGIEDLGFVQPDDQPELWARCGAFVLSSTFDPWPLVVVEASAAGLPVVCTAACGSAVELVRSHHNGLTVATGDAEALAGGLSFIHQAYDRLPEMGRRGQVLAEAYRGEAYADRWEAMFREMLA